MVPLFDSTLKCACCTSDFTITKVKANGVKVLKVENDFCNKYDGVNPNDYEIFVCPHCGYAAFESDFKKPALTTTHKEAIRKMVSVRWVKRDLNTGRTKSDVIETLKLGYLCYSLNNSMYQLQLAKVALRLSWVYRELGDTTVETYYKNFAVGYYTEAYKTARIPFSDEEELTILFLIAEYSRQLGNINDSMMWFDVLLKNPKLKTSPNINKRARDQRVELMQEARSAKANIG